MNIKMKDKPDNSEEMSPATFGLLRAYLAQRNYSQAWVDEAVGTGLGGRSKLEIVESLQEALIHGL